MATYLVRVNESKELVGIFWASSLVNLYWAIDECCDPNICDFKKMPQGGIFFPGHTELKVPCEEYSEKETQKQAEKRVTKFWHTFGRELVFSEYTWDDMTEAKGWREFDLPYEKLYARFKKEPA